MSDTPVADQPIKDGASVDETPAPNQDLSDLQAALAEEFDKRFRGFQSYLDRNSAELRAEIDSLKTANLSPEELEQRQIDQERAEKELLRRENALLKLQAKHPEAATFIDEFFSKETLEDQVEYLSQYALQREAEPTPAAAEDEAVQPTPVKANNPPRNTRATAADAGGDMTRELAMEILKTYDTPGIIPKLRRMGR